VGCPRPRETEMRPGETEMRPRETEMRPRPPLPAVPSRLQRASSLRGWGRRLPSVGTSPSRPWRLGREGGKPTALTLAAKKGCVFLLGYRNLTLLPIWRSTRLGPPVHVHYHGLPELPIVALEYSQRF